MTHYCSAAINFGNPVKNSKLKPVKKGTGPMSLDELKALHAQVSADTSKKLAEAMAYAKKNPGKVVRTDGRASANAPCTDRLHVK